MTRLALSARPKFGGAHRSGGQVRVPATILKAGMLVKGGWTFSREELSLSAPKWTGRPVWLGGHKRKIEVGEISGAAMLGDGLTVEFQLDEAKLADAGFAVEDLGEVSLEARAKGLGPDADHTGATAGRIEDALGVVLLTDERGWCSSTDGCGLHLSDHCQCAECKEDDVSGEKTKDTPSLVDQLKGMTEQTVLRLCSEAGIQMSASTGPTDEEIEVWRVKAERFDKLELSQREELTGRLIDGGHFEAGQKDRLLGESLEQLREYARLVQLDAKPERVVLSRPQGTDRRAVRHEAEAPPAAVNFMDEVRRRSAARFGTVAAGGGS